MDQIYSFLMRSAFWITLKVECLHVETLELTKFSKKPKQGIKYADAWLGVLELFLILS